MATPLGIDQYLDVPITLPVGANRHWIMLQAVPTADPLVGTTLPASGGSGVFVGGVPLDLDGEQFLPASTNVVMRIAFVDTQSVLRGSSTVYAVLIGQDGGGTWHVQGSEELAIDAQRPRFIANAARAVDGGVLLTIVAEQEAITSFTVAANGTQTTHTWAGLRSFAGGKAWHVRLPANTATITVTGFTLAGNTSTSVVAAPPQASTTPPHDPSWSLPPWLPNDDALTITPALHAAAADARNDIGAVMDMMAPTLATDAYLDAHGRTYGVPRYVGEPDVAYHWRITAVTRARHLSRDTLEAHLTRVAGGASITIIDATSQAVEGSVRLDGSRQLDGTWQLGGVGGALPAGEYIVRLDANPLVPLSWITSELHRLRPVGMRPHIQWVREITLGVTRALMGARSLQSNPPLAAFGAGYGDLTADLAATRYVASGALGAGDVSVTLDSVRVSVTFIELEAPDA